MSKNAPDEDGNRGTGTNNANSTSTRIVRENSFIEPVVRNPFVHNLVLTKYDKVKICVSAVFLAPIRFVCICTLISIAIGIAYIATLGVSKRDIKEKPLSGWRRKLRGVLRFCGRAIAFCFGFHHIRKIGTRANRSQATLFVAAPHSSFFDAFVFFVLGLPSGVSRLENASLPFLGHLARACQPIFVDRNDASNKLSTIEEIKRRSDPHSDWPQCLVFPEGTTTNRTCLITFKPGAFIPGLPVQPVAVRYLNRCDTITWTWQGISAYKAMFYTLCQFDNKMEVTYLPVYYPSEQEKADAKLFANNVRNIMADYLQVITTNHTYEDCRLMMKAAEHNLPFESALIEFSKLKEKLDIDFENCEKLLEKYTLYARKSDGKMTLREFCQYLDLPPSEAVNHVFTLYDRDKDGKIDFREFIIGLSLLSRPASTEDTLKLSFQMFDKDGKGHISLADLQSILYSAFAMSSEEVKKLFEQIDHKNDGLITFDEFKSYATQRPEYAKIFEVYHELKFLKNHMEIDKLAKSTSSANIRSNTEDKTTESTVVKRPQSDKIRATEPILVAENNSSQNNKKPTELKAE